jgi:hypothetical protein
MPPLRTAALALVLTALPSTTRAQQPAAPLNPVAREADGLFQEGREALKAGDLPRAADRFEKSQELDPSPGTMLNLASVYEQQGKLVKALELFEHARKKLPDTDDRYPAARDGIARIKPRIPALRINVAAGSPPQMAVRVDGAPLPISAIGVDQRMDPGTYTVTTATPGRDELRYEVTLKESSTQTLTVEAGKKMVAEGSSPQVLPPPPPSGRPPALQAVGFTAVGVGVAGLAIGAITGILAIVQKGDASSLCPQPSRCTGAGLEAAGSGHALAAVSTGAFVVGFAGAGAGVALVLVGRDHTPAGDAAPKPPVATVAPWVLPGGGGIGVRGRF